MKSYKQEYRQLLKQISERKKEIDGDDSIDYLAGEAGDLMIG